MRRSIPITLLDFKEMRNTNSDVIYALEDHIEYLKRLGIQYGVKIVLQAPNLSELMNGLRHTEKALNEHLRILESKMK